MRLCHRHRYNNIYLLVHFKQSEYILMWSREGTMAKVRWHHPVLEGRAPARNVPLWRETKLERERPAEKWKGALGGGILQNGLGRFATLSTHLMGNLYLLRIVWLWNWCRGNLLCLGVICGSVCWIWFGFHRSCLLGFWVYNQFVGPTIWSVDATDGGMEMMARHRAVVAAMKVTSSMAAATGGCWRKRFGDGGCGVARDGGIELQPGRRSGGKIGRARLRSAWARFPFRVGRGLPCVCMCVCVHARMREFTPILH